ncbi:MAG: single-stranded-DNA-specific exonuclease RecJ [Anaerolineae bacterium]|jgi:single-stranded-DNA-specific exonuclease|nr:single-stranded-DNA-specific exonuclease RecJ [Anaerolineae bacterium]
MTAPQKTKRWVIAPPAPPDLLRQYRGMHPILAQVLYNRGMTTPETAQRFLNSADVRHNPMTMPDMPKAIARLRQALAKDEPMVVYGDFDADGVTSTTLMVQSLRRLGAKHVRAYIPKRVDEGYGLNQDAIDRLHAEGHRLIITVDCGIRALDEIAYARSRGIDIIVTDHHALGPELPNAYAVINCKREGYAEDMLAGVGVAFKVIDALRLATEHNGRGDERARARDLDLSQWLDLVAIGTVADLMPLDRAENRSLVQRGLDVLRRAERPGVRALLEVAGVPPAEVNTGTIGFTLGPRINAAGRLESAMTAYSLLAADTYDEALPWANKLQDLNVLRQEKTRAAQDLIRTELGDIGGTPIIFAGHEHLESGIVGLVAGRLVEEFYLPAVVMERGADESRASCRSIPQFDITRALDQCADLLVRHGGHALAAGFTVRNDNIPALRDRLTGLAQDALRGHDVAPTLEIDAALNVHDINEELVEVLGKLEPTGNANRQPLFAIHRARVLEARTVGRDDKHLKLRVARAGQPALDAIGFNLGHWASQAGEEVDVAFTLEINEWKDRRNVQLRIEDVRHPER